MENRAGRWGKDKTELKDLATWKLLVILAVGANANERKIKKELERRTGECLY